MGSSGGGGSSGKVDFPTYMKDWHSAVLDDTGTDLISQSVTATMNDALGNSPYTALAAYDPDTSISNAQDALTAFRTILLGLDDEDDWNSFFTEAETTLGIYSSVTVAPITDVPVPTVVGDPSVSDMSDVVITDAEIIADVDAFADQLDDEITTKVLPRFEAGMRDINAVVSSAFVIGRSNIEGFRDRDVAKHNSALRLAAVDKNATLELEVGKTNLSKDVNVEQLAVDVDKYNTSMLQDNRKYNADRNFNHLKLEVLTATENRKAVDSRKALQLEATAHMIQLMNQRISWEEIYMKSVIEFNRIKIVAKKEEMDTNIGIAEQDGLWDLEVFRVGANVLASISGGTTLNPEQKGPSKMASAIGGGLSGASAGAVIGSSIAKGSAGGLHGAAIGAVVGVAAALLS